MSTQDKLVAIVVRGFFAWLRSGVRAPMKTVQGSAIVVRGPPPRAPSGVVVMLPEPPRRCAVCGTPIAKYLEGCDWHPCTKCGGAKCERCCERPE